MGSTAIRTVDVKYNNLSGWRNADVRVQSASARGPTASTIRLSLGRLDKWDYTEFTRTRNNQRTIRELTPLSFAAAVMGNNRDSIDRPEVVLMLCGPPN